MPCQGLQMALRLYCSALSSACFSSGRSFAAFGYRCQRNNGAKSGIFEESCIGGWYAGPLNRAPRDTRLHRRLSTGGEGWFPQTNEAARSGHARDGCVGGERRGHEARRRCGWCLCGAFLG